MNRRARSPYLGDRLLLHNGVVVAGTMLAGLLGFAFQILISHRFRPNEYGGIFAAMTLLTLITLPSAALTLLMAREASRDRAAGNTAVSASLLREGNQLLLAAGLVLAFMVALGSPWLAGLLDIAPSLVLAAAASMPAALALPLLIGALQGRQRFFSFAALTTGQAALKLVAAVLFGLALGPVGVILGLGIASAVAYLTALGLLRRSMAIRVSVSWFRPAVRFMALVLPSTAALSVLLSADVLLVNHYFARSLAGEYGAVAALGRGIFWGAGGVAAVLFPKVIFHETQGRSGSGLVTLSVGLVVAGGLAGLALLSLWSKPVLTAFAGLAYQGGSAYLPGYAVAMTLLGCASVLVATHQSRAERAFLAVLLPVTVAEPLLIVAFHHDLAQVVLVLTISMGALVTGLAALLLRHRPNIGESRMGVATVVRAEVNA